MQNRMLVHQAKTWAVITYQDAFGVFLTRPMKDESWGEAVRTVDEAQAVAAHMSQIARLSNDEPVEAFAF